MPIISSLSISLNEDLKKERSLQLLCAVLCSTLICRFDEKAICKVFDRFDSQVHTFPHTKVTQARRSYLQMPSSGSSRPNLSSKVSWILMLLGATSLQTMVVLLGYVCGKSGLWSIPSPVTVMIFSWWESCTPVVGQTQTRSLMRIFHLFLDANTHFDLRGTEGRGSLESATVPYEILLRPQVRKSGTGDCRAWNVLFAFRPSKKKTLPKI